MSIKNITVAQASTLTWKQWVPSSGILTAYAVDPTSEERTGKLRSINGSLVPDRAVDAEESTPKDHFCLKLVEALLAGNVGKGKTAQSAERRAERMAKTEEARKAKAEAKAKAKAEREEKAAKAKADREAAKAAKPKKEPKAAKEAKPEAETLPDFDRSEIAIALDSSPGTALRKGAPPRLLGSYEVLRDGVCVGVVKPNALIETEDAAAPKVVISGKSWAVYQGKDRKAFGLVKANS